MTKTTIKNENEELDIGLLFGASEETSVQVLTLYIPNKDKKNNEIGNQRKWVLEASKLLAKIGGGVTVMPPAEGGWVDSNGEIIWESPVIVYCYIKPKPFEEAISSLRKFLHRLGRETNQGEVAFELDGYFYRISKFDKT